MKVEDGDIVEAGTEIAKGIKVKEKSLITVLSQDNATSLFIDEEVGDIDDEEEMMEEETIMEESSEEEEVVMDDVPVQILIRPVQEYDMTPKEVSIKFSSTENGIIDIVPVTQLQYKDGSVIRNLEGAALVRTSLVIQIFEPPERAC